MLTLKLHCSVKDKSRSSCERHCEYHSLSVRDKPKQFTHQTTWTTDVPKAGETWEVSSETNEWRGVEQWNREWQIRDSDKVWTIGDYWLSIWSRSHGCIGRLKLCEQCYENGAGDQPHKGWQSWKQSCKEKGNNSTENAREGMRWQSQTEHKQNSSNNSQ